MRGVNSMSEELRRRRKRRRNKSRNENLRNSFAMTTIMKHNNTVPPFEAMSSSEQGLNAVFGSDGFVEGKGRDEVGCSVGWPDGWVVG